MAPSVFSVNVVLVVAILLTTGASAATSATTTSNLSSREAQALLHWKKSLILTSSELSSWSETNVLSLCNWTGIVCDARGAVSEISFYHFLQGTLNELDFSSFPSLTRLDLSDNLLYGSIPPAIGNLSSLIYLDLSYNMFEGEIPSEIGRLAALEYLRLAFIYNLNGTIPPGISNLQKLRSLDLSINRFTGTPANSSSFLSMPALNILDLRFAYDHDQPHGFPEFILSCTNLTDLDLSDNNMVGSIPASLFTNLPNLTSLQLNVNNLSGPIPRDIGFSSPNLEYVDLSSNALEGEIPASIGRLRRLEKLDLRNNSLTSSIPRELGRCTKLTWLDLSANSLYGELPPSLSSLTKLELLDLSHNSLSGEISPLLSTNWTRLQFFHLQNNHFRGTIPAEISNLTKLESLDLSENQLSGPIPPTIGGLSKMDTLQLSSNFLSGPIPPDIGNLTQLGTLNLASNRLTGELPHTVSDIRPYLGQVMLTGNLISGDISQAFTGFVRYNPNLDVIHFDGNEFTGEIPQNSLVNSKFLLSLKLNGNRLQGPLPRSLINCTSLEVLDIGNNVITDTFPQWLDALTELKVLILRSNRFHGPITRPKSDTLLPFPKLRILDLSNNMFFGLLPSNYLGNLIAMKDIEDDPNSHYIAENSTRESGGYEESVVLVIKGSEIHLERILTVFTTIDLSNNKFEGRIPDDIGKLNSLRNLNLSHNNFTGDIPSSLQDLTVLESLDLSSNQLSGQIPGQLTKLWSLAVLDLSYNRLTGTIPQGGQFNTFENSSYRGNLALCGFPLTKECGDENGVSTSSPPQENNSSFITWQSVVLGYGCGLIAGLSIGYVMFLIGWPKWVVSIVQREELIKKGRRPRRVGRRN